MRSLEHFIKAFPHAQKTDEPPEELVASMLKNAIRYFDHAKYDTRTLDQRILDFIVRYELSQIDTRDEFGINGATVKLFDLKGKRFNAPKGLLIHGPCGTGKTTTARIISEMFGMTMLDVSEVCTLYLGKDGDAWLEDFLFDNERKPIVIDDIGSERKISKFGNGSPLTDIILRRSISWEQYAVPTIYTTNLGHFADAEDKVVTIEKFYGTRIKSRLFGSCVVIQMNGHDWRLKQK